MFLRETLYSLLIYKIWARVSGTGGLRTVDPAGGGGDGAMRVLPFPEPCPRPLLKLSLCLEPSAGLKLDNSIPNTSLSDYASSTLIK